MNGAVINIDTDPETKKAVQALADDWGLTVSSLINAQLRQLLARRRLVLEDSYPAKPMDVATEKIIERFHEQEVSGQISKPYDNLDELFKDLNTKPIL